MNIVITGAAGFIGSCMTSFLNQHGHHSLFLIDNFSREEKKKNYDKLTYIELVERDKIDTFLASSTSIDCIIHLGAKTDTTEMNYAIHKKLNLDFSKKIWNYCSEKQIPLIYASSAATYGDGDFGYEDKHDVIEKLEPLNPYGISKNEFDKWAIQQEKKPPYWYGLKFFNVFGPNEYHKGRMASVVFHAFNQIKETGKLKLFKSHKADYKHGEQKRDFIYVKDVLEVIFWLLNNKPNNGIYNLGSGKAETFLSLANAIYYSLHLPPHIEFIDTPIDIRDKYQYFTEANMEKLISVGYNHSFKNIQEAINDYVKNYLSTNSYY